MSCTDKTISTVETAWKEFTKLSLFQIPNSASVNRLQNSEDLRVTCRYSYRDFHKNQDISTENTFLVDNTTLTANYSSPCYAISSKHRVRSPSGKYIAEIVQVTENGDKFEFIEITCGKNRKLTINLTETQKHGLVKDLDNTFGGLVWSHDEEHLAYIAEGVPEQNEETDKSLKKPKLSLSTSKNSTDKNFFRQNWGEKLTETIHTVLCILTLSTSSINVIDSAVFSSAGPVWSPNSSSVACVQFQENPYKLGLVYCLNRPCRIVTYETASKESTTFELGERFIRSLVFSVDGAKLFYLSAKCPGPHRQGVQMRSLVLESRVDECLCDVCEWPGEEEFVGIYTVESFHVVLGGNFALFSSEWGFKYVPFLVDLGSGEVTRVKNLLFEDCPFVNILTVFEDIVVGSLSWPCDPHRLAIGKIKKDPNPVISWNITTYDSHCENTFNFAHKVSSHKSPDGLVFESSLIKPPGICPLIVFAHGGPHSVYSSAFNALHMTLCSAGLAVLTVNYRGSTGYGEGMLRSLLGRIGQDDVNDVQLAVVETLKANDDILSDNIHYVGGSHGGFIGAHLIGQYPGMVKSACLLNPVINPATMSSTTDIPDWCYCECGTTFDYKTGQTDQDLCTLNNASALKNLSNISSTVAVCLLIGGSDKRVPPSQGLEFHNKLKANMIDSKLYYYPSDGHSLSSISTSADVFCNIYMTIYAMF